MNFYAAWVILRLVSALFPTIKKSWQDLLVFTAILLLASVLRLYRLNELPPGLHYDEAFNATMARNVLLGIERPIFFREDLTEEPMAIYVTALSFAIFGQNPFALRLVSALAGIATVAALYFLARTLFQSRFTAALSALTLAILYWHINFSRLGMEPIFTPLMLTLAFVFLWRGIAPIPIPSPVSDEGGAQGWGLLAGVFLAATLYTYKAALFVPLLIAAFLGLEILIDRTFWTRYRRALIIFAVSAILVYAPLGLYLATHPSEFLERPSAVAATASTLDNTLKVAGMFFGRGDDNPRSNLPGRPALDPFLAIGFSVGVIVCAARIRKRESRFLLLWLIVMSLPSVVTDFAPHFGRNIGVTPAIALIVAVGFVWLIQVPSFKFQVSDFRFHVSRFTFHCSLFTVYCSLLTLGLAFSAFATTHDYFDIWGNRTGQFDSFDVGLVTLAQKLRDRPSDETIYLTPTEPEHYTVRFTMEGRATRNFDGRRALVIGSPAVYGIVTREDSRTHAQLEKIFPASRVVETIDDYTGKPYAIILRVEGAPQIAPQKNVGARLGDAIELIGYDLARAGNAITLTAYWKSLAETRDDYTVFAHLVGALNPATSSPVWAQDDTRPGRGSYSTTRWRAGEIVIDEYRLSTPANLPRGDYTIEIGMYILETGARIRITDAQGAPMECDCVPIERITLP